MDPIQPTNHNFIGSNFLSALPSDALSEISSYLAKEHLGNLSCVCNKFNNPDLSNALWTNLVNEQLPEAYQKLPSHLLKEKFQSYHNFLKDTVNVVSLFGRKKVPNGPISEGPLLTEECINQLNDENIGLQNKYALIKAATPRLKLALENIFIITLMGNDKYSQSFGLLLELLDVNEPLGNNQSSYPMLFEAMACENIHIAKMLIDAGANFEQVVNGLSIAQYLQNSAKEKGNDFPQELYDEVAAYAIQKKEGINCG